MSADGQKQKLAWQVDGHCSSSIWNVASGLIGRNSTIAQPGIFSADAPLRHCELRLCCHVVSDPAKTILPTFTDSRGVLARDIRHNPTGRQIDPYPVDNPSSLLA